MRLHKCFACKEGNIQLYLSLIEQIRLVQKEMANRDALFTLQNILDRMSKAIELSKINASNQEILWHLQEVMALLFKLQSIPS